MHTNMPYQCFKTILQTTYHPRLKIWILLNQLRNKQSFIRDHEHPHKISQNIIIFSLTSLTNSQNIHQYFHVYGHQQEILISFLQTHPSQLTMKEMPRNVNLCCLSSSYPFRASIFLAKAWCQQFYLVCVIHIHNMISLAKDKQIMNYAGVLQTIILTL